MSTSEPEMEYVDKPNTTNYKGLFMFWLLIVPIAIGAILVMSWIYEASFNIKIPGLGWTAFATAAGVMAAIIILQAIDKSFTRKILGIPRVYIDAVYPPPLAVAYDAGGSKETDLDIEDLVQGKWFGLYLDKCKFIDIDDAMVQKILASDPAKPDPAMEAAIKAILDSKDPAIKASLGRACYVYHMVLDRPLYYRNVLGTVQESIDPVFIFPAVLEKCIQRHPANVPSNGFRYDHPDCDHLVISYQVTILGDLPVYFVAYSSYNQDQLAQPTKLSQDLATNIVVKALTFLYGEKAAELDPINQMRVKAEARTSAVRNANVASAVKDISVPPADSAARDSFNRYKARWGPRGSEIPVYWFVTIAITVLFALKLFGVY